MLLALQELYDETLAATDGEFGRVHDFLFREDRWVIEYLVADTGKDSKVSLVLLTAQAFSGLDHDDRVLHVNLTRAKIESSLPLDSALPISLQGDPGYQNYHQPPSHWIADLIGKASQRPYRLSEMYTIANGSKDSIRKSCSHVDVNLWSAKSVSGYHIHGTDGEIGHLNDFGMDDETWAIRGVYVRTGIWLFEKEVFIDQSHVQRISHDDGEVFLNLTKGEIAQLHRDHASEYGMDAFYAE